MPNQFFVDLSKIDFTSSKDIMKHHARMMAGIRAREAEVEVARRRTVPLTKEVADALVAMQAAQVG